MRTYLDTGVLIAAFRGDRQASQAALAVLEDESRHFVTSEVLRLELLPKSHFHHRQDEIEYYETFLSEATEHVVITPAATNEAFTLACQFDVGAMDALHLGIAVNSQVDEFVTTEGPGKPMCRIPPERIRVTSI